MRLFVIPTVDDKNPLYCPDFPAALYLKSLHDRVHYKFPARRHRRPESRLFISFARTLEQSSCAQDSDDSEDGTESGWILGNCYTVGHNHSLVRQKRLGGLHPSATGQLDHHSIQEKSVNYLASPQAKRLQSLSLKRKLSFSDLGTSPKYARSQSSFHDSSFDVEIQPEKLEFLANAIESSPQKTSHYHRSKTLDVKTLADQLDSALPGIRLRERLLGLKYNTPEAFMDFMAENGMFLRLVKTYS